MSPTRPSVGRRRGDRTHGPRDWAWPLLLFALLLVPVGVFLGPVHDRLGAPSAPSPRGVGPLYPTATQWPTPIRHAFVIVLENANASNVLARGSFEASLARNYSSATHYYAVCHPSAPNYLSMTSGAPWQCGSDAWNVYSASNVGDLADQAGRSWKAYLESMPTACSTTNTYPYAVRHNPFVYYADIVHNASRCDAHDVPMTAWATDLAAGSLPNLGFIVPNVLDDGHDTNISYADTWLKGWLGPLLTTPLFNSSVFFVVYDEATGSNSGYNGTTGGPVYFTAVSPYAVPGGTVSSNASHFNLLSTLEWLLGLGSLNRNDSTSRFPALKGLFRFPSGLPASYPLTGRVVDAASGLPISGANVSDGAGASTLTGANGSYRFALANGSYTVEANAPGYHAATTDLSIAGAGASLNFSLSPYEYLVSGNVTSSSDGSAIAGARVQLGAMPPVYTNLSGRFALAAPNGTYGLSVGATGFTPSNVSVPVRGAPVSVGVALAPAGPPGNTTAPLGAAAVAGPNPTPAGTPVNFSVRPSGGSPPYAVLWTFGDGSTSTQLAPDHDYARAGNYTAVVRVTDAANHTVTLKVPVRVVAASSSGAPPPPPPPGRSAPSPSSGSVTPWLVGAGATALVAGTAAGSVWIRRRSRIRGRGPES